MEAAVQPRRRRRKHSPEFKAEIIAACKQPGVSIGLVARERGLNPGLVRHWLDSLAGGRGASLNVAPSAQQASAAAGASFKAVRIEDRPAPAAHAIRLEIRRGAAAVIVQWPAQDAVACGAWLKEWLR